MGFRRLVLLPMALLVLAAVPALAEAETRSYLDLQGYGPAEELIGPANHYPGSIAVAGVPGTVTKVTVTTLVFNARDELDMALVGPNGAKVMLMSDACNTVGSEFAYFTFDDNAADFVPQSICGPRGVRRSFKPLDYGNPAEDNLAVNGGPAGPFSNSLSVFNGISPNGSWILFMIDDSGGGVGFEMDGWALNLEIQPPPPLPPTVITVPGPPLPTVVKKTGKRAAALAKCKKKKTQKQRAACSARARKLPV